MPEPTVTIDPVSPQPFLIDLCAGEPCQGRGQKPVWPWEGQRLCGTCWLAALAAYRPALPTAYRTTAVTKLVARVHETTAHHVAHALRGLLGKASVTVESRAANALYVTLRLVVVPERLAAARNTLQRFGVTPETA